MITGYSDKLSVRPNEAIRFMVSTDAPTFDLSFVRLTCGDPELLETVVPVPSSGEYQGRKQGTSPDRPG